MQNNIEYLQYDASTGLWDTVRHLAFLLRRAHGTARAVCCVCYCGVLIKVAGDAKLSSGDCTSMIILHLLL